MANPSLSRRHSIGAKIFVAFVAMGLITGALGAYGFYVLSAAGKIVVDTYDGSLMAINFARSASLTFAQMNNESLRRAIVPDAERTDVDGAIETLAESLSEDLDVVEKRAVSDKQRAVIMEIRGLVEQWVERQRGAERAHVDADLTALGTRIIDRFDVLIELTADYSFIDRRKAVWSVSYFKYTSIGALVMALLLSAAITWLLARRIIRPLSAAAKVADRIAGGELQTPIPGGGRDETGILLHSMTVMQDNVRAMMEREVAERRSAQRRLVDALESSREGVVLVDGKGKIVIANSQVPKFCPELGPYMVEGENFATAFAQLRLAYVWRPDMGEGGPLGTDYGPAHDHFSVGEYQMPDGRWIRFSRSETTDGGFILFLSDFTEIKEREEIFKEAKLQAEVASTAKTNFLANMSHELRTPLNAIIGFSELITGQHFGVVGNPRYVEYAGDILHSGKHLLGIISGVLDLAKSEAGKLELTLESVDLCGIVDECAMMMRTQCTQAQIRFIVDRPETPLVVQGEPARLRQIILNLLSNAVKFTKAGSSVSLRASNAAWGDIEVQIVDTGIGMSAEDLKLAMTPFGQVETALSRKYQGTGLGLPLTAAFVELHAGRMDIESAPGRGTKVTVRFPRSDDGEGSMLPQQAIGAGQ
ncbi:MAG TPA: ATP-binding protein [Alphaproteobacteria bacterium]